MFQLTLFLQIIVQCLVAVSYGSGALFVEEEVPRLRRTREFSDQTVFMGQQLMTQRHNLRGNPSNGYSMDIDIGTPKQRLNVLVDTGSSNFAIAAAPNPILQTYYKYNESSTYSSLNEDINVRYTVGSWSGILGQDAVTLPTGPDASFKANIAAILKSDNFFINGSYWQGILGLGYADIALPDSSLTPFFESLVTQTDIPNIFTMQLCGVDDKLSKEEGGRLVTTGTLTIGGIDKSLYEGKITYTPLRREWFYEVVITDIKINNESLEMDCKEYNNDKTIVDSGTTRLRLPSSVYDEVVDVIKEEVDMSSLPQGLIPDSFWTGTSPICEGVFNTTDLWKYFPSMTVTLQGEVETEEFDLRIPSKQYLKLNRSREEDGRCYLFGIAPSERGTVLGATLMEGYYVIFDRQNQRVGFATSTCAKTQCLDGPECSLKAPTILGPFKSDAVDCAFNRAAGTSHAMEIAGYILLGLCILCFTPIGIMYLHLKIKQRCDTNDGYTRQHNEISSTELEDDP